MIHKEFSSPVDRPHNLRRLGDPKSRRRSGGSMQTLRGHGPPSRPPVPVTSLGAPYMIEPRPPAVAASRTGGKASSPARRARVGLVLVVTLGLAAVLAACGGSSTTATQAAGADTS